METQNNHQLTITRVINAPRKLVWKVWTDPKHLAKWWGPRGFTAPVCEIDVREKGAILIHMKGPDGMIYPMTGEYVEITKHKKLVFKSAALDAKGEPLFQIMNTITFEEEGETTKLIMHAAVSNLRPEGQRNIDGMKEGWAQTLDRLEEYSKNLNTDTSDREFRISRLLNAPRELVWKVWTEPDHIKNWWGPNGFTNTIFTMDVKAGGEWDFIMHGPDGADYKNKSIYKEIVKPEKIVFTHIAPNFQATITFEEQGNKTLLTWGMLFETAEEFERVIKVFKADEGQKQNVIKLENYLANLQK
jgi:uncharacterized protein YndB with AHSA1/START domain